MQQIMTFLPFIIMIVLFYLIIFIPENKRKKKYAGMLNSLKVNDEIITKGGIMGKIVNLQEDYVILESGPDRARIKLSKNGVLSVVENKAVSTEEKKESK